MTVYVLHCVETRDSDSGLLTYYSSKIGGVFDSIEKAEAARGSRWFVTPVEVK